MAKVRKEQCKSHSRRHRATPSLLSCARNNLKDVNVKKSSNALEKKDWEDAMCSVCMEVPHNAILLLCSSYNKGCRPYMCATSHRYSNCFEQYKKTYTKAISARSLQLDTDHSNFELSTGEPDDNTEVSELLCPLCRRQVKGWTVVEAARESLNAKKRSCVKDDCSFVGNYKQLRKHVRSKHPFSRPREVDPIRKEKWKRLECENERNDVISTILSSTPGAMVLGDYVLEPNNHTFYGGEYDSGNLEDDFFSMSSFNNFRLHRVVPRNSAVVAGRPFHRLLLGRARRGRRHGTLSSGR